MTHPRLSVSEMCTYPWSFGDELDLWDDLGVKQVGVITAKLDAYGRDKAVAALRERGMRTTTVITGSFDLSSPATWDMTRVQVNDAVELAAEIGGCVYFTPGRRDGRSFDELTASLAEAVAPCAAHARERGVHLAIEPSLRTDVSYVHTLRDGLDVAAAAGIDVIADLGNCWMERDYEQTVRRGGPHIAVVQFADAIFGTSKEPPPGGRAVPGDGDLPIADFFRAAVDAGYTGPFELEMVGPKIEAEGHEAALRRGVERADALLREVVGA
jgi:sugar phosphate isomerase/epimerase